MCEFAFSPIPNQMPDELMPRIRMWRFMIMGHTEFVPKSVLLNVGFFCRNVFLFYKEPVNFMFQPDPAFLQDVSKNITRQGLTTATLNYLRASFKVLFFAIGLFFIFVFCVFLVVRYFGTDARIDVASSDLQ